MELRKPVSSAGDGTEGQVPEAPREGAPPGEEKPRVMDRRRVRSDGEAQTAETEDEGEAGGRYPTFVEGLQKKVEVAEEKLRAHIERVNKESAEFRARQQRDLERRTLLARKELASGFIGVADDLSRASAAALEAKEDPRRREEGFDALVQGVQMIQGQFFQQPRGHGHSAHRFPKRPLRSELPRGGGGGEGDRPFPGRYGCGGGEPGIHDRGRGFEAEPRARRPPRFHGRAGGVGWTGGATGPGEGRRG